MKDFILTNSLTFFLFLGITMIFLSIILSIIKKNFNFMFLYFVPGVLIFSLATGCKYTQIEQEKRLINTYEATINTCSDLNELESIKDKIVINALSTDNKELITSYVELMDLANKKITELEKTS